MPGVPSNRACERCKQRHLKCDETRPGCRRCAAAGIECPGYVQTRKFIDEGATVRRRYAPYQKSTPKSSSASTAFTETAVRENASSPNKQSRQEALDADRQGTESHVTVSPVQQSRSENGSSAGEAAQQTGTGNSGPDAAESGPANFGFELSLATAEKCSPQQPQGLGSIVGLETYGGENSSPLPRSDALGLSTGPYSSALLSTLNSTFTTTFDQHASYPALQSPGDLLPQKNDDNEFSDILSEFMIGSEHEMAFLMRHFSEVLGPWLDLFDTGRFFSSLVPIRGLSSPLLKYAAAAVAAKHLGRVKGAKLLLGSGLFTRPATMEVYPNASRVDWFFKAANYYHQAIFYLKQALPGGFTSAQCSDAQETPIRIVNQWLSLNPVTTGNMSRMESTPTAATLPSTTANIDDLLATASILSLYEFLDAPGPEWESHLNGLQSLPEYLQPTTANVQRNSSVFSQATRAAFWVFAREDYVASYINRTKTRLDPENLQIWRAAGIPIDEQGILRLENGASLGYQQEPPPLTKEDMAANGLVWLLLKLVNFLAESKESQLAQWATPSSVMSNGMDSPQVSTPQSSYPATTVWLKLCWEFQTWFDGLPETFRPCIRLEQPRDLSRSPDAMTPLPFPEIFYSVPTCAATMQHYHFARIALLLNRPPDVVTGPSTARDRLQGYREVTKEVDHRCREICGIALGRPQGAVRIHMVQPLFVAGQCLESPEERQVIVDLLRGIEADLGWATDYRVKQLQADWER